MATVLDRNIFYDIMACIVIRVLFITQDSKLNKGHFKIWNLPLNMEFENF